MEETTIKGKKMHMTQIFEDNGKVVPVTLIKVDTDVTEELLSKEVTVTGKSKGKGFTGVMKRWGFHGQQATRGQSNKPRAAGAIGSQTPGRVLKGKKMAGKTGDKQVTVKGLKIVRIIPEEKSLMVSGPIPGARNSKVLLRVQ